MRVTVLFFGVLKEMLSSESQTLDLPTGATVDAVLEHYRSCAPAHKVMVGVGDCREPELRGGGCRLRDGDEVALLPPVSGGSTARSSPWSRSQLTLPRWSAAIKQGEDGAVVVFDGIVRNNTRGRRTLFLVYEAYQEMALRQMQSPRARRPRRMASGRWPWSTVWAGWKWAKPAF